MGGSDVRKFWLKTAATLALAVGLGTGPALADADWVPIDPANEIYMNIFGSMVIIELHPEVAPVTVARIKQYAKSGFYDGLTFHRVISDFMAQGGDPQGTGEGGSKLPDLKAEFTFHDASETKSLATDDRNQNIGVRGGAVVLTEPSVMQYAHKTGTQSWLPHCRGTVSMARASDPNSANSQFFIMFSATEASALDRQYTAWGHVVYGMDAVDRIQHGEPPRMPTHIAWMKLGTDVPEAQRIALEELSPASKQMQDLIADALRRDGGHLNACDVEVPVRIAPKPQGGAQ